MGLWDTLRGRRPRRGPQYDSLFGLPAAAITLQSAAGFEPTGTGAICFRAAQGAAFAQVLDDVRRLLDSDEGPPVEVQTDDFGFTWVVSQQPDVGALATDLHAVVTSLELEGFASQVLCSLVTFRDRSGRVLGLVYLQKAGTFYPFAPTGEHARDNVLELQVRDLLAGELPIERDLSRWMALWGAPGL